MLKSLHVQSPSNPRAEPRSDAPAPARRRSVHIHHQGLRGRQRGRHRRTGRLYPRRLLFTSAASPNCCCNCSGATMSMSWPRCAPSSSRRGLARADGRKRAAPLQHPLPRERLFPAVDGSCCRRRAIRSSASASTPVCASCAKSSPNTCGSFPSMWARRCPWRRKTGGGPLGPSDGMQFSYAFDPQTITDEVTEAVLAAFFRRIVFGEPTPE